MLPLPSSSSSSWFHTQRKERTEHDKPCTSQACCTHTGRCTGIRTKQARKAGHRMWGTRDDGNEGKTPPFKNRETGRHEQSHRRLIPVKFKSHSTWWHQRSDQNRFHQRSDQITPTPRSDLSLRRFSASMGVVCWTTPLISHITHSRRHHPPVGLE